VTLFDLHPVVLLLGVIGMAILWRVRSRVAARVAARRFATVAMGFLAIMLLISLSFHFIAPGPQIRSSRLLNWKLNSGVFGSRNAAAAQTTTVVTIEVEHPVCPPIDTDHWLADPIISYTPWAVTITMRMNDAVVSPSCSSQQAPHEGSLPLVGGYLTGIFYGVKLGEPLSGRSLFDGSSFPPAERSLR
jgi:hypothetical protein